LSILSTAGILSACNWAGETTKNALNKGGELAGSAATEVIEGVTTGVENSWSVDVQLSEALKGRGLKLGKTMCESDANGRDNKLVVYFSTDAAFTDTLTAIAFDQSGSEMGRTQVVLALPVHGADFATLQFQAFTDLERKSRVEIR
jgi:hypothetical protein